MRQNLLKPIIWTVTLLLSVVAVRANNLSIVPLSLAQGDTYSVNVDLINSQPFSAFQTVLTLPDGIELYAVSGETITLSERASNDHSLKVNATSGNVTKIISFSNGNTPFSGDSGTLFTIHIKAADNFNGGNITLSNTIFSDASNQDVKFDETSAFISRITLAKIVQLSESTIELKASESVQLMATVLSETATDKTVTWSVADETIATVDQNGIVTAVSVGATKVRASVAASGVYAECSVNVVATPTSEIVLSASSVELETSESVQLTATVVPETATDKTVVWSVADETIATVAQNGLVTAVAVGNTTVWATAASGVSAECSVSVVATPAVEVVLNTSSVELKATETVQLSATVLPETTTNKTVVWISSDESVAVVDQSGFVTALSEGECVITAKTTDGSELSASCEITVKKPEILVSSISLTPFSTTGKAGEQIQISATVLPENATNKTISWSSSDEGIATVSDSGLVSLIKEGTAVIIASATDESGVSTKGTVIVVATPATEIVLSSSSVELEAAETVQLSATILPETTTDKTIVWMSSDESVAVVDQSGFVTALSEGECVITAKTTDGSELSATCEITVKKPEILVSSISLTPVSATGKTGEQIQISAAVLPENATNKTISWSSSDESIATVSDSGLVSLIKKGQAVITASATDESGVSAECAIIVSETSGIGDVLSDKSAYVRIFNMQGIQVYDGPYSEAKLARDYYIVVCGAKSIKVKTE